MVNTNTPYSMYSLGGYDSDVEGSYDIEDRINDDMRASNQQQALWHPNPNPYAPVLYSPPSIPAPTYGGPWHRHPTRYNDSGRLEDRSRVTLKNNSYLSSDTTNRDNHNSNNVTIYMDNPHVEFHVYKPRNSFNWKCWGRGKKLRSGGGGGGAGGNLAGGLAQGAVQGGFAAAGWP